MTDVKRSLLKLVQTLQRTLQAWAQTQVGWVADCVSSVRTSSIRMCAGGRGELFAAPGRAAGQLVASRRAAGSSGQAGPTCAQGA